MLRSDEPVWVWKVGKFKNLRAGAGEKEEAIVSYCTSIARAAASGISAPAGAISGAFEVRGALMRAKAYVELGDIVSYCWAAGVPVLCLKVFPLPAKHMHAMAVRVRDRSAILLARELSYPAQAAFDIAHEMGHIALGHLETDSVVADFEDPLTTPAGTDAEEDAANRYALELLTGEPRPTILPSVENYLARDLADAAQAAAPELGIDAGTLILCLGHHTHRWDKVFAALNALYGGTQPVAEQLNRAALAQLQTNLSSENDEFLRAVLGIE